MLSSRTMSTSHKAVADAATAATGTQPLLEIHLERESKIYYPGEMVRGTAVLRVARATTLASGVYLDFQAKASTEWTTGGDAVVIDGNKEETPVKMHTGETVFQHQVKTLLGGTHQSGALRMKTVGNEGTVDFDKVPGTGDIYIPCVAETTEKMKLKVEAMESAMTLDVHKLVTAGTEQIFYMTTKVGNMQKGAIHLSAEFCDYKDFFPDNGKDHQTKYTKCLVLHVHKFRGKYKGTPCTVSVRVHDVSTTTSSSSANAERKNLALEAGDHAFPFRLALRDDAPGSASWKIGTDSASISYSLKAYFDINQTQCAEGLMLTVIANRPLPRPALLSPYKMETGDQPMHSFGCCRPRRARKFTVSLKLLLGRLVYAPGEVLDLTGSTVVNNSTTPQRAQIVLNTYLQLTGGGADHEKKSLSQHQVFFETEIPAHKTVILTNLREFVSIRMPAIFPSYSGVFLDIDQTNRLNACVKWSYTLEIRLPDWGSGFYCRTPILVPAAPPFVSQLQQYRRVKADPLLTGQYSIFEHAVSGSLVKCVTAPTLTSSFGDKGRKLLVDNAKPIWMGGRDEYAVWIKDETNRQRLNDWMTVQQQQQSGNGGALKSDGEYSDLAKLFYFNVVNAYAGPSGTFDESLE
jgi:hypothetical protein